MRNADEASQAGRTLAEMRWTPEARLKAAVDTVLERSADLDDSQRGALLEAARGRGGDGR
jgi:hypothetical protein